jgi:hypothetical protein
MIFMHSAYDIEPKILFYHAFRLQVKTVYITLHMNLDLLLNDAGIMTDAELRFDKFVKGSLDNLRTYKSMVRFTPLNESGQCYYHNMNHVTQYATCRKVRLSNDISYNGALFYETPQTVTIKFTISTSTTAPKAITIRNEHSADLTRLVLIERKTSFFEYFRKFYDVCIVPKSIVDRVTESATNLNDPRHTNIRANIIAMYKNWNNEMATMYGHNFMRQAEGVNRIIEALTIYSAYHKIDISHYNALQKLMDSLTLGLRSLISYFHSNDMYKHKRAKRIREQIILPYETSRIYEPLIIDIRTAVSTLISGTDSTLVANNIVTNDVLESAKHIINDNADLKRTNPRPHRS